MLLRELFHARNECAAAGVITARVGPQWRACAPAHRYSLPRRWYSGDGGSSSCITSSPAQPDTVAAPSRMWPSEEQLARIDLLVYRLGKYRAEPPRASHAGTSLNSTTGTSSLSEDRAAAPVAKSGSAKRRDSLNALSTRARRSSVSAAGGITAAAPRRPPAERQLLGSAQPRESVGEDLTAIRPHTPLPHLLRLAERQRRETEALTEWETGAEAQWTAVTTHPPALHADEAQVLHRFGMGGYASPETPGFDGLFRQHWQDFYVTEMVSDVTATCGGRPVSRKLSFAIPSLPPHLTAEDTSYEEEAYRDAGGVGTNRRDDAAVAEAPDDNFFRVDVRVQVEQLLSEPVHPADLAKVSLLIAAAADGAQVPEMKERGEQGTGAATALKEPRPTGDDEALLAQHQASLLRLERREAALAQEVATMDKWDSSTNTGGRHEAHTGFYLQCTLHKQHISHSAALANIAQTLRVHPRAISVSGIKDYIGDTVQRVRIAGVSPNSARTANAVFRRRRWKMTLSDFSYESTPLSPGDLYGNNFRIVLRDVTAPRAAVETALRSFEENGFPNYYGCQRFSWFAGTQDAAFALLHRNWLAFAFRFLNYTDTDRTLRELLQRSRKYPHPVQDEYRRNVVRRLRQISVEPSDLNEAPFLSCPTIGEPLTGRDGGPINQRHELILWQLREAYFDLHGQSRRLTAQRLSSYLWNQVVTLRLHHFGARSILLGDHVIPMSVRRLATSSGDRRDTIHLHGGVVTEENVSRYTIGDVVHPGFSFDGIALPDNPVGMYYEQVCGKYRLDWRARHSSSGLHDFHESPRPIIRFPIDLSHNYNEASSTLVLQFALERGCYANVAVTELMKLVRCAGSEDITLLPAPELLWESLGSRDPGYVTSMQDIYEGYEEGLGFVSDEVTIPVAAESETKVWDHDGPLFLPESEDPVRKALEWGNRNLLSNMERRTQDAEALKRRLFEKPLADQLAEGELERYATHTVPMSPNTRGKKVFFKVLRRKQRYAGAPRVVPRVKRGAQVQNRSHSLPAFKTLNKDSWNVTW